MCLVTTAAPNLRPTRPGLKALGGGVLRSHPLAGKRTQAPACLGCGVGRGAWRLQHAADRRPPSSVPGLDEDWDEIEDCMAGTGSDASGSSAASTVAAIEDPAEESMSEADQVRCRRWS